MNKTITAFMLLFAWFGLAKGQQKVESTAYSLTLKTLLSHTVEEVSVENAKTDNALILDARERKEFDVSHIKGAKYVGYEKFDDSALENVDKDQPILVYCSVGYRSEKISERLIKQGFTNIRNLYGGIFEWVNQGKPIVTAAGEATNEVHAYSKTWGIWLNKGEKVYD